MRKLLLIGVLLLSGCTSVGPVVTDISSDGKGGLNIEQKTIVYNAIFGVLGAKKTTHTNIQLNTPK
jgi:type IV secretion system protein VirB7